MQCLHSCSRRSSLKTDSPSLAEDLDVCLEINHVLQAFVILHDKLYSDITLPSCQSDKNRTSTVARRLNPNVRRAVQIHNSSSLQGGLKRIFYRLPDSPLGKLSTVHSNMNVIMWKKGIMMIMYHLHFSFLMYILSLLMERGLIMYIHNINRLNNLDLIVRRAVVGFHPPTTWRLQFRVWCEYNISNLCKTDNSISVILCKEELQFISMEMIEVSSPVWAHSFPHVQASSQTWRDGREYVTVWKSGGWTFGFSHRPTTVHTHLTMVKVKEEAGTNTGWMFLILSGACVAMWMLCQAVLLLRPVDVLIFVLLFICYASVFFCMI